MNWTRGTDHEIYTWDEDEQVSRLVLIAGLFNFAVGKAILSPPQKGLLDVIAGALANPESKLTCEILGAASRKGSLAANQKLSDKRALAVAKYFYEKRVPENRIIRIMGLGEEPWEFQSGPEENPEHRRVTVTVYDGNVAVLSAGYRRLVKRSVGYYA